MRHTATLILAFMLMALPVFSQAPASPCLTVAANGLRPGDSVVRHVLKPLTNISDTLWSLPGGAVVADSVDMSVGCFSADSSAVAVIQQGTRQYYTQRGDTLFYGGFENSMIRVGYDMPELRAVCPMSVGDSVCGLFHGTGTFCDKFFIHTYGRYTTAAEACGTIVLPDGKAVGGVLRLHTVRYVVNDYYPIDSLRRADVFALTSFTADSIRRNMPPDSMALREDIYLLYVPGFRYPVVEQTSVTGGGEPGVCAFYTPPYGQPYADCAFSDSLSRACTPDGSSARRSSSVSYDVGIDAASRRVTVDYETDYTGSLVFILSDTMGRVVRSVRRSVARGERAAAVIDCQALSRGQYVMYVCTDKERLAEKFSLP